MRLLLPLLALALFARPAHARPPMSSTAEGVVRAVDRERAVFIVERAKGEPLTLHWTGETYFLRGAQSVGPALLRPGAPVAVRYRVPFFGRWRATRVFAARSQPWKYR